MCTKNETRQVRTDGEGSGCIAIVTPASSLSTSICHPFSMAAKRYEELIKKPILTMDFNPLGLPVPVIPGAEDEPEPDFIEISISKSNKESDSE